MEKEKINMEEARKEYEKAVYELALKIKNDFSEMLEEGNNYVVNASYAQLFAPTHEESHIRASKVAELFAAVETFEDEYHYTENRYYPVPYENKLVYPISYPFRLDMPSTPALMKAIDEELE